VAIIRGIYYTIQFPNHSQYWQIADLDAPQLPHSAKLLIDL
jgi:hypothetical protein